MKRGLVVGIAFIICCWSCVQKRNTGITEAAISKYLDTTIKVYEPYAVLKLPIQKGTVVWNPGVLEAGPGGRMFVANMTGEIYSLLDTDGDDIEDAAIEFCDVKKDGFRTPSGMVFKGWDLYVGLPQQVRVYRDVDRDFVADTSFVYFDHIPFSDHPYEYTSGLRFDSQGWMYISLATDSWNAGASPDPNKYRGAILKISPDGKEAETVASGIRSVHGMSFNGNGQLFFADNQGGQNPVEELHLLQEGHFYGYNTSKYGDLKTTPAIAVLRSEVAPAEMEFQSVDGQEFLYTSFYGPGEYWERGAVARIHISAERDSLYIREELVADLPKAAGLAFAKNGDLYVSSMGQTDYWYFAKDVPDGAIYRLIRAPWVEPSSRPSETDLAQALKDTNVQKGKFLFATLACASCHGIDGKTELLGPNLRNIGEVYNREELLEEIKYPSKRMKPGTFPTRISTVTDEVFLGRVITQDEEAVHMMLIGNIIKKIPIEDIASSVSVTQSMMYEGLLDGLKDSEINALLDYLISLGTLNFTIQE
ncbi:MAG: c-type cytochrome [Bacteroidota bacterium]